MFGIRIIFFIVPICLPALCLATEEQSTLNQLNQKIATMQASLSAEQMKRVNYIESLKTTEIAAGQTLIKLQKTTLFLRKQQAILQQLSEKENLYRRQLTINQAALAKQIRSAYLLGRETYLKLTLNQSQVNHISRLLMYYRYVSQSRITIIRDLQSTLNQLHQTQQQIQEQTTFLANLQTKQLGERSKLEHLKQARQFVVTQLNNTISNQQQKLNELLTNKRLLEQTVDRLEKTTNMHTLPTKNFASLKGQLNWPTQGQIMPFFGAKIYQSELKWDGILIRAPTDQSVYAVADGQVVFAKWLPGYGLLLIISHGHGYMTLYGRNHYLYKKPGDVVQMGDLIARVGNSGGYDNPALYFAIRYNAIPQNPLAWCHRKGE